MNLFSVVRLTTKDIQLAHSQVGLISQLTTLGHLM
jgi:hypothetical protein